MAEPVLEPGDVVVLKSGSSRMTIAKIDGDQAQCEWREGSQAFREPFTLVALKKYEEPTRDPFFDRQTPRRNSF